VGRVQGLGVVGRENQKAKGKRQKAKMKKQITDFSKAAERGVFIFAFCLLPFAF
jgi:hypothetical protein